MTCCHKIRVGVGPYKEGAIKNKLPGTEENTKKKSRSTAVLGNCHPPPLPRIYSMHAMRKVIGTQGEPQIRHLIALDPKSSAQRLQNEAPNSKLGDVNPFAFCCPGEPVHTEFSGL